MSDVLFDLVDSAAARRSDPDSSHAAAESATPSVWASQQAALDIMRAHGRPMTAEQIVMISTARELPHSESRMRSTPRELSRKGMTELAGKTDPAYGRARQLWRLTDRGQDG